MGATAVRKKVWMIQTTPMGDPLKEGNRILMRESSAERVAEIRRDSRALSDSIPDGYEFSEGWRVWVHASTTNEALEQAKGFVMGRRK